MQYLRQIGRAVVAEFQLARGWGWAFVAFLCYAGANVWMNISDEHVRRDQEAAYAKLPPDQQARVKVNQLAAAQAAAETDRANAEAARRSNAAAAEKREQLRYACKLKSICTGYGKIRQDCATAGSFKTCLSVKMGDDNATIAHDSCTDDGHVAGAEEPGYLDCLTSGLQ